MEAEPSTPKRDLLAVAFVLPFLGVGGVVALHSIEAIEPDPGYTKRLSEDEEGMALDALQYERDAIDSDSSGLA